MKQPIARNLAGAAGLLALLAILVLANVVASQLRVRADVTREKLYTLSDGTRRLLGGLPRDVTLKFYFTRGAEGMPIQLKQYAQRIEDLLREYAATSGGRVALEVFDPKPDSTEEEWAQRYGLRGSRLDPLDDGPGVYLGLVGVAGARQAAIPFFSPADEPQLEYLVSRLIADITAARKPRIAVISSLPVMGSSQSMFSPQGSEPWVFLQELRSQYDLVELPGRFDEIPADVSAVLLIHPRGISELALYALDQFVLRGGRLIAFVDPLSLAAQRLEPGGFSDPTGSRSDLNRLTSAWGLHMEPERVVADAKAGTVVQRGDGTTQRNLAWLSLRGDAMNRAELSTATLELLMLPMAGAFTGTPADGLTLTPLLRSAPGSGLMTAMEASMGTLAGTTTLQTQAEPLNIAVRLAGRFKTAFPEGRPADPDQPADVPGATPRAEALQESTQDGAVVLVADADVLADDYSARRLPIFGRAAYQLMNDNVNFVANLAGQLAGSDALIGLRSRGSFDRPFDRVLALQKTAQERWRQEELKLQEQVRITQMKIEDLETSKDPDQKLVITPAQRQEIESFRQQMIETRRQLKEVRKNLRQDIETLGLWVKGLNVAAMPAAVIAFGLFHGWRRRRGARGS